MHHTETDAISREAVIDLLGGLVAIDSVNPSLVPGSAGEADIARFVARWLADARLEVQVREVVPGRPNVIARRRGSGGGRSLLLNAHMDTVGVAGMQDPFVPRVKGDRLYGRGAYDMKGGLASIMLAAHAVEGAQLRGDLILTAVMDEEYASLGTEAVVADLRADGAVVTEPTGLRLCVAHKGFSWLRVETRGRAAHGSKPELGVDAIAHMGRVLHGLEGLGAELLQRPHHPLLGAGSIHASLVSGGQELSSYPERCSLEIERRTIPGETEEQVLGEIEELLRREAARDEQFAGEAELFFWRDPFEVPLEEPVVQVVREAATRFLGRDPAIYGDTPWMDAALLSAAGIPTVVFGPGGGGAHAAVEYGSIESVAACAAILADAARAFCG